MLVENQIEVNPTHVEELRDLIALNTQNASFATSLVDVKQNTFYIEGLKYAIYRMNYCDFQYHNKKGNKRHLISENNAT